MEDKDFRDGDKVTCLVFGRGEVVDVSCDSGHPVRVFFPSLSYNVSYTRSGHRGSKDIHRTLYHGHNVTFEVQGEEIPDRTVKRYVNVYMCAWDAYTSSFYNTKEEALKSAGTDAIATGVEVEVPEDMI